MRVKSLESFSLYSTDLEINFDEQDRSEVENAAVPLENQVTLSLRPTQIPFTVEITHATVNDALNESLFNLTEFLNADFTDIIHANPGKIFYAVVVIMLLMEDTYRNTQCSSSEHYVLSLDTTKLHYKLCNKYCTLCFC